MNLSTTGSTWSSSPQFQVWETVSTTWSVSAGQGYTTVVSSTGSSSRHGRSSPAGAHQQARPHRIQGRSGCAKAASAPSNAGSSDPQTCKISKRTSTFPPACNPENAHQTGEGAPAYVPASPAFSSPGNASEAQTFSLFDSGNTVSTRTDPGARPSSQRTTQHRASASDGPVPSPKCVWRQPSSTCVQPQPPSTHKANALKDLPIAAGCTPTTPHRVAPRAHDR